MSEFFITYQKELLTTVIFLCSLFALRFVAQKTVHRIGMSNNFIKKRSSRISSYISIILSIVGILLLIGVWGIDFEKITLLFSSIFAVIGVALFAQWSIISNITSGVILFFSFPFKIGDKIKIMDKEIIDNEQEGLGIFTIEEIKAFHIRLRKSNGSLLTYPNNLMLQKGITIIKSLDDVA